jgi:septation ring formation regulator EzrA
MIKRKTKKAQNNKEKMSSSNQVLVEHFDSKFDLLLDGYAMTNKKIDDLRDEMNDRFKAVDDRFNAVDDRFDAVDERFGVIDERFAAIDDKFEAVFDVLDDIKKEMKSVKI